MSFGKYVTFATLANAVEIVMLPLAFARKVRHASGFLDGAYSLGVITATMAKSSKAELEVENMV